MEYINSYRDSLTADILPGYDDSLYHHGIKGMKWGVRRYQNPDGSLTPEGAKRYKKSVINAVREANAKGHNDHRNTLINKINKRVSESRDYREITEINSKLNKLKEQRNKAQRMGAYGMMKDIDSKIINLTNRGNEVANNCIKLQSRLFDEMKNEMFGAVLKDIGEKDTLRGRELLRTHFGDNFLDLMS